MRVITVNAEALKELLAALIGPPHYIRELQAMRDSTLNPTNPITVLVGEYNAWATKQNAAPKEPTT